MENIKKYFFGKEAIFLLSRTKNIWLLLITLSLGFGSLYLGFTLFPGQPAAEVWHYFSVEQIEQGRAYSLGSRLCFISSALLQLSMLVWLVFSRQSLALSKWTRQVARGNYWIGLLLFFLFLWLSLRLLDLPFTLFKGYYWQQQWGFSTQPLGEWCLDYLKFAAIDMILSAVGIPVLFWLLGRFPTTWWLYSATFISMWIVILMFIFPILITPLFNHFTPVQDQKVTTMVQELANKAEIPVNQVLMVDASRRTTRSNAYFAGLGQTKQIVLFDNLLHDYPLDEIKAVIAHEMAHWRQGHILQGIGLNIIAIFLFCGVLATILKDMLPHHWPVPYPAHAWAIILLFFSLVSFASSPLQGYISQHMEAEADQVGIMLTNDIPAAIRLQVHLASKNAADISPPAVIQHFSSHPSPLARIQLIQGANQ